MKILFFGTPRLAQIVLKKLIDSPFRPHLVITAPDSQAGRGQKYESSPVKITAEKYHISILQPKNLLDKNFIRQLAGSNFKFDLAILVAFGKIIPKDILLIPKKGFINVHPSLLPKYRGPSPIQTAILEEDKKTGVSIMLLEETVDHGPVLAQKEVAIEKEDTHATLVEKLGKLGVELLIKTLPQYLKGRLKPKPQDHSKATFTKRITKADGEIDLLNPPNPQVLDRMVRAFYPWPGVWARLQTADYRLRTIKFLPGNLIQPEGKRPMTIKEFLNGYPAARDLLAKLRLT